MLFLIEQWESVRDFIAAGGNVLYVVALALFLMWAFMIERFWYLASVYPNPSNGLVSISSEYINGQTAVQLIDINGRQVFNRNYNFENKINLNFENISSGIYILKLKNT